MTITEQSFLTLHYRLSSLEGVDIINLSMSTASERWVDTFFDLVDMAAERLEAAKKKALLIPYDQRSAHQSHTEASKPRRQT